jgi:hypothetical protein
MAPHVDVPRYRLSRSETRHLMHLRNAEVTGQSLLRQRLRQSRSERPLRTVPLRPLRWRVGRHRPQVGAGEATEPLTELVTSSRTAPATAMARPMGQGTAKGRPSGSRRGRATALARGVGAAVPCRWAFRPGDRDRRLRSGAPAASGRRRSRSEPRGPARARSRHPRRRGARPGHRPPGAAGRRTGAAHPPGSA